MGRWQFRLPLTKVTAGNDQPDTTTTATVYTDAAHTTQASVYAADAGGSPGRDPV